jgi:beta-galactosidase
MGTYDGLNYWEFAKEVDVISWDNYPTWHSPMNASTLASNISFVHDINRSLKGGKPFMLMESTPSATNWQPVAKLKRPGMHLLSSLQAIAHGSDTVQYFQWRKSRGSSEKFHGAVVDHCGHENTRVFREVTEVGLALEKLSDIVGTTVNPDVGLIFDWENLWAIKESQGVNNEKKSYEETCKKHYQAFWEQGVPVDVIDMTCDFSKYKILAAPMLYMLRPGVSEKIEQFVKDGGTFVTTYFSGLVDENDLCFLNGFPGPLRKVMGIWVEETDGLYEQDENRIKIKNDTFSSKTYIVKEMCDIIHSEGAEILATYQNDFYAGQPALTCNHFGKGNAYYIAFRNNEDFEKDFYLFLINDLKPMKALEADLPTGVTAQLRTDGETSYIFVMNFSNEEKTITLNADETYQDKLTEEMINGTIALKGYGIKVLTKT